MGEPHYSRSRNPRNGTIYVYKVLESYYDKEKKQSRNKRVLVGKVDPETNKIIPTSPRGRPKKETKSAQVPENEKQNDESADYKRLYENEKRKLAINQTEFALLKNDLDSVLTSYDQLLSFVATMEETVKKGTVLSSKLHKKYSESTE